MVLVVEARAQAGTVDPAMPSSIGPWRVFVMLFLMVGPIKILVPFVNLVRGADVKLQRSLATRAILFSAAALALAGLLGKTMLDNLNISLPVLTLAAGLILFLVALRMVLEQQAPPVKAWPEQHPPDMQLAISPLAFPIIVTPYGIAAVIVFAALAQDDSGAKLALTSVILLILAMNWAAMIYADRILKWFGTALQVFAIVLGIAQVALGLQLIVRSLMAIGVLSGHAG